MLISFHEQNKAAILNKKHYPYSTRNLTNTMEFLCPNQLIMILIFHISFIT